MPQRTAKEFDEAAAEFVGRNWKMLVVVFWLLSCAWFIYSQWRAIHGFGLGDTDDNMRMMQVRGLLHGQGWFDLRQYHLNAPFGANIHWSRLVDLPIAGLILLLRPLIGGAAAERWAVGIAPLLPYLLVLFWIDDERERDRLRAYAVSLSAGTGLGFLLFASYANRLAVCDALSPVWLSDALLGGALLFGMAWLSPADWKRRLALAVAAAVVIA